MVQFVDAHPKLTHIKMNTKNKFCLLLLSAVINPIYAYDSRCSFLSEVEGSMIASRANFYISNLKEKNNLSDLRAAAFWNYEIAKTKTLKLIEDEFSAEQLYALSKSGCPPVQAAAFTKSLEMIVGRSIVSVMNNSSTIEQAVTSLSRLSRSKSLADIPSDMREMPKK